MQEVVSIPFFQKFPVHCGTTTRHFPLKIAHSQKLLEEEAAESIRRFLNLRPKGWVQAGQIHGAAVAVLDGDRFLSPANTPLLPDTDGLVTQTKDQVLSIVTADCLPIFFYLEDPPSIGLVHAGWRGSARRIVQNAVSLFKQFSAGAPAKLHAAFGTSIGPCCYEVGAELEEFFPKRLGKRDGRLYLDLAEENRRQLIESGLSPQRIGPSGPCGSCHLDQFYSYRKEGPRAYRMLSWIALKAGV